MSLGTNIQYMSSKNEIYSEVKVRKVPAFKLCLKNCRADLDFTDMLRLIYFQKDFRPIVRG